MAASIPSDAPGLTRVRRVHGPWAVLAGVLVAGAALGAGAAPAPASTSAAPGHAATQRDCDNLLHQFDVAWPAHRDAPHAESARHSRDLGATDCRAGRYADGVHNLRRALHDIGVKPVKSVATSPAR